MFWLTKGSMYKVGCSTLAGLMIVLLSSCAEQRTVKRPEFYNIDSLVSKQLLSVRGKGLEKSVSINNKVEHVQLTPDSNQWKNELEIFRQLDQVNKPTFADAYVVSDVRDTNSNLMVRETKSRRAVPVSVMRLYYLKTPDDVRKIEATLIDENAIYINTRQLLLEFERNHSLRRYRIEGSQKMVMDDSVNFVIAGVVEQ